MKIQEAFFGEPKNKLYQDCGSGKLCSVLTVEQILERHLNDVAEYEKWDLNDGYHIAKKDGYEAVYARVTDSTRWVHDTPPDGQTYYGQGSYFPIIEELR